MSTYSRSNENRFDESMRHLQHVKIKIEETEESVNTFDTIDHSIVKIEAPEYPENGELEYPQLSNSVSLAYYPDSLLIKKEKQNVEQEVPSSAGSARVMRNPTTVVNNKSNLRLPFEKIATAVDSSRDDPKISNEDVMNDINDSEIEGNALIFIPKISLSGFDRGYTVHAIAGNRNGLIGYSAYFNQCIQTGLFESIKRAKQNVMTISRFMYYFKFGKYYTVPYEVIGKSANITVTLYPRIEDPNLLEPSLIPYIRMIKGAGIQSCTIFVTGTKDLFNENVLFATFKALKNLVN